MLFGLHLCFSRVRCFILVHAAPGSVLLLLIATHGTVVIDDRLAWMILGKCTRCRSDLNEMGLKLRLAAWARVTYAVIVVCAHTMGNSC